MEIHIIGRVLSILLILFSGMVLVLGINFFRKEKGAGKIRWHLLIYSMASFVWAFNYGYIGFLNDLKWVHMARTLGIMGIEVFLFVDLCAVADAAHINEVLKCVLKGIVAPALLVDWILFSNPDVDIFYLVNGYMTWIGRDCFARRFHSVVFVLLACVMATLGVIAFRRYHYKRQKGFMVCFYIANLSLLSFTLADTFFILEYALPTSGFGALLCTLILWIGTFHFSAFDASMANIYDRVYDLINVGILMFDDEYHLLYMNPYAKRILAHPQYQGKGIADLFEVSEDKVRLYFDEAVLEYSEGFRIRAKKTGIECSGNIKMVLDGYKEPYCYVMVIYDITKEANMLEELKAANAAKEHFLTSMSHEIRTPINSMLGMNEMILRESTQEEILRYAANMESSGGLLLSIVNDILDFSKIESGKLELFPVGYDLSSTIYDVFHIVDKRAVGQELQFEIRVNPQMPALLYGDEIRVKQIILNLLINAVKYTDEGFILWECDYSVIDEDHVNLIMSVRDTGRGMKTTEPNVLFQAFTRLDEQKNQTIEGTGLGLSITKALLDLMGGTISVESIYGVGSKFTIVIPQKITSTAPIGSIAERIEHAQHAERQQESTWKAPQVKILAVDDVEMNLVVIGELLKETEIQVEGVCSGYEALQKCRHHQYDLILMDHMMPEMDGIECRKRIKAECEKNRETPIIMLTANAIVGMRERYLREGFDDYLTKPLDGKKLEETIKAHLSERQE